MHTWTDEGHFYSAPLSTLGDKNIYKQLEVQIRKLHDADVTHLIDFSTCL